MIQSYRSKTELPVPPIGFGPTTFQLVIRVLNTTEQRLTTISVEIRWHIMIEESYQCEE